MLKDKTVVNIPGCPANPYNLLGTVLQFATFGTLPELDAEGRPMFAYGRTIHEHCPRRAHFDAGRFAETFGDEGHRLGYCLYKLGCKGPETHANCSVQHFCEIVDAWPIGLGHPCFGCTEKNIAFSDPAAPDGADRTADAAGHVSADPGAAGRCQSDCDRRSWSDRGRAGRGRLHGVQETVDRDAEEPPSPSPKSKE